MHLIESYALNTGLKIKKPYVYETYAPIKHEGDYITFQPFGSTDPKKYAYWDQVMSIIKPELDKLNIGIVQLGVPQEPHVEHTEDMRGNTSFNQAAYLIKRSLLHLGADSFGIHFASSYQKKIVSIYSTMLPSHCGPYWSENQDVICLNPPREKGEKPSYAAIEYPKSINKIKPEDIANSIFKLLDIDYRYPYKTLYVGEEFQAKKIEIIPTSHATNWKAFGVDSLIVRMDREFNEGNLIEQLRLCPCSLVSDKPINFEIFKAFKKKIVEYVHFIDDKTDVKYFHELKKIGVKPFLLTKMSGKKFNKIKLKYLDIANIITRPNSKKKDFEDMLDDEEKGLEDLYYQSARLTIKGDSIYTNQSEEDKGGAVTKFKDIEPRPIIDAPVFWEELASMTILRKTS